MVASTSDQVLDHIAYHHSAQVAHLTREQQLRSIIDRKPEWQHNFNLLDAKICSVCASEHFNLFWRRSHIDGRRLCRNCTRYESNHPGKRSPQGLELAAARRAVKEKKYSPVYTMLKEAIGNKFKSRVTVPFIKRYINDKYKMDITAVSPFFQKHVNMVFYEQLLAKEKSSLEKQNISADKVKEKAKPKVKVAKAKKRGGSKK